MRQYPRATDGRPLVHPRSRSTAVAAIPAALGLVVEEPGSGFCGAVVGCAADAVHLADRHGRIRVFPLAMTFLLEGNPVRLSRPRPQRPDPRAVRSPSGSTVASDQRATVAVGTADWECWSITWCQDPRSPGSRHE